MVYGKLYILLNCWWGVQYLQVTPAKIQCAEVLGFLYFFNQFIHSWNGYGPNLDMALILRKSMQNLMLPFFFGTRIMGLHHSLFGGSITPRDFMASISSLRTDNSLSAIQYGVCLMGVSSFKCICCFTRVVFPGFSWNDPDGMMAFSCFCCSADK